MNNGKTIGYIRVSTFEQNHERQLENFELDKIFTDKCSGKDTKLPALVEMLNYVRDGDTIDCSFHR
jgi:DNA invertase Pin-like site-specific DNA recombinase